MSITVKITIHTRSDWYNQYTRKIEFLEPKT